MMVALGYWAMKSEFAVFFCNFDDLDVVPALRLVDESLGHCNFILVHFATDFAMHLQQLLALIGYRLPHVSFGLSSAFSVSELFCLLTIMLATGTQGLLSRYHLLELSFWTETCPSFLVVVSSCGFVGAGTQGPRSGQIQPKNALWKKKCDCGVGTLFRTFYVCLGPEWIVAFCFCVPLTKSLPVLQVVQ